MYWLPTPLSLPTCGIDIDSFYPLKGICNQIKDKIETNIMERSNELKSEKVYAGIDRVDGLWSMLHTMNALISNEIKIQGLD